MGGDIGAATRLVGDLATDEMIASVKERFGGDVIFVFPHAEEAGGRNKIPQALAAGLATATGNAATDNIVQSGALSIPAPASWSGSPGVRRSPARSSQVGAMSSSTTSSHSAARWPSWPTILREPREGRWEASPLVDNTQTETPFKLPQSLLAELKSKHSDDFFKTTLGIAPERLTTPEALALNRRWPGGVDEVRDRILAARPQGGVGLPAEARPVGAGEGRVKPFEQDVLPPPFYSAVVAVVEQSKTKSATAQQWWATISNAPGIKREELEWIQLEEWLTRGG